MPRRAFTEAPPLGDISPPWREVGMAPRAATEPEIRSLSPDVFKGQWTDSLGNKVFVCFADALATVLVAHLSRPPRPDIQLSLRRVPHGGGWQCGNAVLDPTCAFPDQLTWVAADGRLSTWVRHTEGFVHGSLTFQDLQDTSMEDDFVCMTPENWD
mmetsp:Transcript_9912/g.21404  ORF Transcript_9912/g.21404 Transcript_9912/m.21404 type:complete len:156 (-) Transcript_9912:30-497(-)